MNSYAFTSSQFRWSPLHFASEKGHVEVVAKLIAGNADINSQDIVSTSLHVSQWFRLYQGLPMMSAWNTRWRGKVPAIVSQSLALRTIRCFPNEPWVHTQSKKYIGSALKNSHEKAQGSCTLSPWSLEGAAIFNFIIWRTGPSTKWRVLIG